MKFDLQNVYSISTQSVETCVSTSGTETVRCHHDFKKTVDLILVLGLQIWHHLAYESCCPIGQFLYTKASGGNYTNQAEGKGKPLPYCHSLILSCFTNPDINTHIFIILSSAIINPSASTPCSRATRNLQALHSTHSNLVTRPACQSFLMEMAQLRANTFLCTSNSFQASTTTSCPGLSCSQYLSLCLTSVQTQTCVPTSVRVSSQIHHVSSFRSQ